jgi:predicted AlkP superfamily pyrophosphatase or phosphodiesterase
LSIATPSLTPTSRPLVVCVLAATLAACAGSLPATAPAAAPAETVSGSGGVNRPEHLDKPHLILVSLDGFRPAYLDEFDLPNMRRVLARGARASAMMPVFPSLTFPNHYSLVTGLRPARHGIVANSFYDPDRKQTYTMSAAGAVTDGSWYRGEPIWVTAERQGMVAACFFWPGSEAAIGGVRPTMWRPYAGSVPNDERVETVLEWLRLPPERRPHVITLYFSEVDSASHDGPVSAPGVEQAARSLDRSLGALLDGIDALGLRDRVYVLLTSDHGMVETTSAQTIRLDSLIDLSEIEAAFDGAVASLHVRGGRARALRVRNVLNARLEHGRAYLRDEMPERFHYRADPRVGDIVVVMDESWTLTTGARDRRRSTDRWGMHGWDPALPSMHALFVAAGPGIRAGLTVPRVENIDVYPFMAELLGLRPAPGIDGRAGAIRRALERARPGRAPLPQSAGSTPLLRRVRRWEQNQPALFQPRR